MRLFRGSAKAGFTPIPNPTLRDRRLSYKARGILTTLLSHSDGWQIDAHDLAADSPDGRSAVLSGLKELVKCGYVFYRNQRGEAGRMEKIMIVFDEAQTPTPVDNGKTAGRTEVRFSDLGSSDLGSTEDGESAGRTEVGFSDVGSPNVGPPNVGSPDLYRTPEEDQKKISQISQSAQAHEATRALHNRYRLTDQEAARVIEEAHRRAATPIRHLVRYLEGMDAGDLADIVAAVMDATEASNRPPPTLGTVNAWCGHCDEHNRLTGDPDMPRRCQDCHPLRSREAS